MESSKTGRGQRSSGCYKRVLPDQEIVEISLIENIQREDLNPVEEALAYKRLIEEFHLKQDEIAERVSKSRTAVTNSLRLLKLSPQGFRKWLWMK